MRHLALIALAAMLAACNVPAPNAPPSFDAGDSGLTVGPCKAGVQSVENDRGAVFWLKCDAGP